MDSSVWIVGVLVTSILLIIVTIVKCKLHPFLALMLASFYVGILMGMSPADLLSAVENGIGGTLGFLAAIIGLGTILGKMLEISGAAEKIGITLLKSRFLKPDVIMVIVGLICGITLFVEVGVVLLIPLAFSIAKKNRHVASESRHSAVYRPHGRALHCSSASCGPFRDQSAGR